MKSLSAIWREGTKLVDEEIDRLTADIAKKLSEPRKPRAVNDNTTTRPAPQGDPAHLPRLEAIKQDHGGELRLSGRTWTLFGAAFGDITGQVTIDGNGKMLLYSSKGTFPIDETPRSRIKATGFQLRSPNLIPLREFLFGKHYQRRYVSVTLAPGGVGKSAHAASETLAMVTGRPLLDPQGPLGKKLNVWLLNLEDPIDEIERSLTATAMHFSIDNDQIGGRLFTDSGRDQEFVIVRQEGRDFKVCEPLVEDMLAEIQDKSIDVIIVDPFVSTHEVPENDNSLIQRVAKQWRRIADEGNCAVELIHHVTKGAGEVTADSGRGGGALKDAARSVRVMNPMTKEEAEKAGLETERGYFRVDFGKVNKIAGDAKSQWRRFVSVPLMNGKGLVKKGDEVGVVEAWRWPSANEVVADISEEQLFMLKKKIGGLDCRDNIQSLQWAGYQVAQALGINIADAAEKRRVHRMLEAWKKEGHFAIEPRPGTKGTMRPCLVPVFPTDDFSGGEQVG
ncbi:AAA family ATPase [Rhizobium aegyptiacum]|uniref:AAA family ATPase n=1 Tax=Rhizobium aegyptiacum TaxID=1764550 RepID=UPI0007E54948|nr:AAA family ATPase [Rhizobium aegyptiacum]